MAKDVSLKVTYSKPPETKGPNGEELHGAIKEGGFGLAQEDPEYIAPLTLFASGVTSSQVKEVADTAKEGGLDEESTAALRGVGLRLRFLEEENQDLFQEIKNTYRESAVSIQLEEYKEEEGYVSLRPSPDNSTYFQASGAPFANFQIDIGPAKGVAKAVLNKVIEPAKKKAIQAGVKLAGKAAVSAATKVGGQAAAQAVTQAIGSSIPVIGNVVAFIVTTFVGAFIDRALAFSKKKIKQGEDTFGGALLWLVGGVGQFFGILGTAFGATISSIVGIIIWIAISIPLAIFLALFIINSGAYLVPPAEILAPGENPYIRVEKFVEVTNTSGSCDDTGPSPDTGEPDSTVDCENSALPLTVQYTIRVTALRGSLTNITFGH